MISKIDRANLEIHFIGDDGEAARQSYANLSSTVSTENLKVVKEALSKVTANPVDHLLVVTRTRFE